MIASELIKKYENGYRDFSDSNLRRANLRRADLRGADLSGANLIRADLSAANLSAADLRGSDLSAANLSAADLRGANLRRADLRGADLSAANLRGVDLRGADLSAANLSRSIGVEYAQCVWRDHGECGRQLTAVLINDEIIFYCGCFMGSARALIDYIIAGKKKYRASRYKAMNFLISCFDGNPGL